MKKTAALILILITAFLPVSASDYNEQTYVKKFNAEMAVPFEPVNFPKFIKFKSDKEIIIRNEIIPENSLIKAEIIEAIYELRWHKSGYFICKIIGYVPEFGSKPVDVSDKEIYLIGRKLEKTKPKDAVITATELTASQTASFFIPGIDILYYFTKGAIQREKHKNWFKAGVYNAYDNSIFWFQQKGNPIRLYEGDEVCVKSVKKTKIPKLKNKINKRKMKRLKQFRKRYKSKTSYR